MPERRVSTRHVGDRPVSKRRAPLDVGQASLSATAWTEVQAQLACSNAADAANTLADASGDPLHLPPMPRSQAERGLPSTPLLLLIVFLCCWLDCRFECGLQC